MLSPLVEYFYRKEQQWRHQIVYVSMETMLPRQMVTERRRHHQSDGEIQAIAFSLSASNVLLQKFDVTKRQKVCTVKIQICLPSCRSESSNIQLGQIRQTGYKETVCYMISTLIFYFYRQKKNGTTKFIMLSWSPCHQGKR
jgi:hypothetical protein